MTAQERIAQAAAEGDAVAIIFAGLWLFMLTAAIVKVLLW